ncbi:MAG: ribosome-binding factor A, partial [Bacteroidota bacterium]
MSKRQLQVAETIKRNFSIVLQQEGAYIYGAEVLVTVTSVKMSPDMGIAKIYLSVYNTEDKQSVILQLEEQYHQLRQSLATRV